MIRARVAVVFAGVTIGIGASAEPNVRMPAPASASYARGTREADDAACRKCHSRLAEEHDQSLHHAAFSDASFQRGLAQEPTAFCRGCHAPESKPDTTPDAFASEHGVACVTCHRPDSNGAILSGLSSQTSAPHAISRVADFGTRACASCHEFAFPGGEKNGTKGLMQKTMTEHAQLGPSDRSCASCHMPKNERGKSGHRFVASRDREFLAKALAVTVERKDERAFFTLEARDVGHAFPTGDLFRRLVVRLRTEHGTFEQPLARNFGAERGVRYEASDLRLEPKRQFGLPLANGTAATWEVAYQRVTAVGQAPPFTSTVEAELVLARGRL